MTYHRALFDYRKALIEEAARTGSPVVRHLFIPYPGDPGIWSIPYQEVPIG
ncbi:MAG: hypothetical protein ACPLYD_04095 [Anaerolineae bacterium]